MIPDGILLYLPMNALPSSYQRSLKVILTLSLRSFSKFKRPWNNLSYADVFNSQPSTQCSVIYLEKEAERL